MATMAAADYCNQTPITPDQIRALLPAITDPPYPDTMLQAWIDLVPIDPCIWGPSYTLGQALWVAHELTKFGPGGLASKPGVTGIGAPSSRSVNGVSVSYDVRVGFIEGAG